MAAMTPAVFAFAVGLTLAGLVACIVEIATGSPVLFAEPPLSRRRLALSLVLTALAGPFMLGNEALAARADGRIGRVRLATFTLVAGTWALALGVLSVALAGRLFVLLG